MANNNSNDNSNDERNPFVAFRHFADEHIGAALSALSDVHADWWKRLEDAEGDARKAWERFNNSFERATNPARVQTERESEEKPAIPVAESTEETVKGCTRWNVDGDQGWSDRGYVTRPGWDLSDTWPPTRFGFDRFSDRPGPWRPSVGFMARNRYSPLVLERRYPTDQQGKKWRDAFEDLLKTESGEITTSYKSMETDTATEPPEDWLKELVSKQMVSTHPWSWMEEPFHPQRYAYEQGQHRHPWHGATKRIGGARGGEANTELDLYEYFLGDRSSTPAHQIHAQSGEAVKTQPGTAEKSSIISTMTTTEQRMLPDGTVTTKTVLRKKFSDGTEERQETTNTIPATPTHQQTAPPPSVTKDKGDQKETKELEKPKAKKNNWFWSSSP